MPPLPGIASATAPAATGGGAGGRLSGGLLGAQVVGRRVLAAYDLRTQQPYSFVPHTTDFDPAVRAVPNRLLAQLVPTVPNRVGVGDITYLPR